MTKNGFHRKDYLMQHHLAGATIQVATEDGNIIVMYDIEIFGPAHGILVPVTVASNKA